METTKTIKGYELHERIGSGGFGVVHRATQTTLGREVAIKIILPHFANQPDFIRRFETEAQIIARLEHPFIVPLHDYWRDPDGAYLVMRLMKGGSLRDALVNGPFELEAAALFLDQITSALALAHRSEVIHRDLKPANVLLDEDGNAYLSDFGIAKETTKVEGTLTGTGMVLGSPDYLSPEQARSEPVTPQADIYSLGIMLYEVLTGQHPFPNVSSVERMYKHLNEPIPLIETLPSEVADGVNAIVQKATAKNPALRYDSALAVAVDFRRETALGQRSEKSIVEQLTLREQEILQMIVDGCSNKEIAQRLFITVGTVKWYVRQVYQKLRVRSRVQAMVRARELNLVVSDTTVEPGAPLESTYIALPEPENPYKGLRAFQVADAHDFFGRERLVQRLVNRLGEHDKLSRFLAVVGPSGSGKSSVVKAGLVPALWRGDLPGSDRWFVVEMMPGTYPLDELEIALTRAAANQAGNLREHLERDARGLVRVAGLILPDDGSELMVIVDQFEEVFTLVEEEARRTQFLDLLHTAVTDPRSRVRVIITLRADFYDRPLNYPEFGELVRSRMETVLPLSADELEAAIAKPAARVGISFEPGLVATITSDVHYQPGALPLLQYALTELFEQRSDHTLTHDAYQALGGATGALARRAEELYQEQGETGRENIRQMFLRLVTLGEGAGDTRRRVPRSELLAVATDEDLMDEALDTYTAYRLLTLDHDPATRRPTVEIAHEAILREWERLRGWLNESRHDIRQQRLLAAAVAEWREAGKDPSYLLSGARLDQFAGWAADTRLALTLDERDFLDTSIAEHERRENAEQERQQRELETQRQAANRLRYLVMGLVVFLIAAFGLSLFAFGKQHEAQDARATSDTNAVLAQRERDNAQDLALVNGARAAMEKGDLDTALALAMTANRKDHPSAQAQLVLSEAAYTPGTSSIFFQPASSYPYPFAVSPDGRTVLSGNSGPGMQKLYLWDLATGQTIRTFSGHESIAWSVAFSPDGRMALSTGAYPKIVLWDVATGEEIREFEVPEGSCSGFNEIWWVHFSPDGKKAYGSFACVPVEWDVATGKITRLFDAIENFYPAILDVSPDGSQLLTTSWDGTWVLWDIASGQPLHKFGWEGEAHTNWVNGCFDADGRTATTGSLDGTVIQWDLTSYQEIRRFTTPRDRPFGIACSPSGHLVMAGANGPIHLWDMEIGEEVPLTNYGSLSNASKFTSFGGNAHTVLFVPPSDDQIRVWDLQYGAEIWRLRLDVLQDKPDSWNNNYIAAYADISPDYRSLLMRYFAGDAHLSDAYAGPLFLADMATGKVTLRMEPPFVAPSGVMFGAVFTRDGKGILGWFATGQIVLWDATTGEVLRTFVGHRHEADYVGLSPDGHTFLSWSVDNELILWDMTTGEILRHSMEPALHSIHYTPDGRYALLSTDQGAVVLWDIETGQEARRFEGHSSAVYAVSISPDGRTFLSGDQSGMIILWDIATGQKIQQFTGRTAPVNELMFSRDGQTFFSLDTNGVLLWDITMGAVIRNYPLYYSSYGLHLGPDENSFYVTEQITEKTTTTYQWRIDSAEELIAWTLSHRYVRELTCAERDLYQLEPRCNVEGVFPTSTPYATTQPVAMSTPTLPGPTASPEVVELPQATPYPVTEAHTGEQHGQVAIGESQWWNYAGKAGETITVRVNADHPCNQETAEEAASANDCLNTWVTVITPDGAVLTIQYRTPLMGQSDDIEPGVNTDSLVEGLVLPVDGTYWIAVSGSGFQTGGAYTLTIKSQMPEAVTPTPEASPSGP